MLTNLKGAHVQQVMAIKDLSVINQNQLSPKLLVVAEITKFRTMPASMRRQFQLFMPDIFLTVYAALVRSPLE